MDDINRGGRGGGSAGLHDVSTPIGAGTIGGRRRERLASRVAAENRRAEAASTSTAIHVAQGALTAMARTTLTLPGFAFALLAACGPGVAHARQAPDEPPATPPRANPERDFVLQPMSKIKPGDHLLVEVLEALPDRPISGERLVRADGTIFLGSYGDLQVAGLDRREIKIKLVKHMRKYLDDDVLGLIAYEDAPDAPEGMKKIAVDPADSGRVFVDDSLNVVPTEPSPSPTDGRPRRMRPGDRLAISVLEALPGRPLHKDCVVRPDGTICLDYYGDLQVAGLDRREIKVRLVKQLQKWFNDEPLGLEFDGPLCVLPYFPHGEGNSWYFFSPSETNRIYVDDTYNDESLMEKAPKVFDVSTRRLRPGDLVNIELLETLPGRPLHRDGLVRADGTVTLGFYGDLRVVGLTRDAIKVKLVEHLMGHLSDEKLGLLKADQPTGKLVKIAPADASNVFVDETPNERAARMALPKPPPQKKPKPPRAEFSVPKDFPAISEEEFDRILEKVIEFEKSRKPR